MVQFGIKNVIEYKQDFEQNQTSDLQRATLMAAELSKSTIACLHTLE